MVFNTIVPKEFGPGMERDLYSLKRILSLMLFVDAAGTAVFFQATLLNSCTHIFLAFHTGVCGRLSADIYWVQCTRISALHRFSGPKFQFFADGVQNFKLKQLSDASTDCYLKTVDRKIRTVE
jgi:hypothetical protein